MPDNRTLVHVTSCGTKEELGRILSRTASPYEVVLVDFFREFPHRSAWSRNDLAMDQINAEIALGSCPYIVVFFRYVD